MNHEFNSIQTDGMSNLNSWSKFQLQKTFQWISFYFAKIERNLLLTTIISNLWVFYFLWVKFPHEWSGRYWKILNISITLEKIFSFFFYLITSYLTHLMQILINFLNISYQKTSCHCNVFHLNWKQCTCFYPHF